MFFNLICILWCQLYQCIDPVEKTKNPVLNYGSHYFPGVLTWQTIYMGLKNHSEMVGM